MSHFVLQTINGVIEHDFVFHLKKAIEYNQWLYPTDSHTFELTDIPLSKKGSYPVGDLKFVFSSLSNTRELNLEKMTPINVPEPLNEFYFTQRKIIRSESPANPFDTPAFVKSDTNYKSFNDLIKPGSQTAFSDLRYFFSEEIQIESEWRVFVRNRSIVGIGHYAGYPLCMPNANFIKSAISEYDNSPDSYTLDIGVSDSKNMLLEVHPFVSCGLYGFADLNILPDMFKDGIRFFKK